ncbi:MAG: hypothetical protein QM767_01375 [Anaeromyxobacter sp.]
MRLGQPLHRAGVGVRRGPQDEEPPAVARAGAGDGAQQVEAALLGHALGPALAARSPQRPLAVDGDDVALQERGEGRIAPRHQDQLGVERGHEAGRARPLEGV